jgi:hypothetical protein
MSGLPAESTTRSVSGRELKLECMIWSAREMTEVRNGGIGFIRPKG